MPASAGRRERLEEEVKHLAQEEIGRCVHGRVLLFGHRSNARLGDRGSDGFNGAFELRRTAPTHKQECRHA